MARQKSAQISGIPVYHSAMQIRKVKAHVWVRGNSTHSKDKRDPDTLAWCCTAAVTSTIEQLATLPANAAATASITIADPVFSYAVAALGCAATSSFTAAVAEGFPWRTGLCWN